MRVKFVVGEECENQVMEHVLVGLGFLEWWLGFQVGNMAWDDKLKRVDLVGSTDQ